MNMSGSTADHPLTDPHLAIQPLDVPAWLAQHQQVGRCPQTQAPSRFTACLIDTPLGEMVAVADPKGLHLLEFTDRKILGATLARLAVKGGIALGNSWVLDQITEQIGTYFAGSDQGFSVPLVMHGTSFQRRVWQGLLQLPRGTRHSYKEFAQQIGLPKAVRAVGAANGRNQLAVVIPCHRLLGRDGALTGYGGGLWRKRRLLALETGLGSGQMGESA